MLYSLFVNYYLYQHVRQRKDLGFIKNAQFKGMAGWVFLLSFFLAPLMLVYVCVTIALYPLIKQYSKKKISKEDVELDEYLKNLPKS